MKPCHDNNGAVLMFTLQLNILTIYHLSDVPRYFSNLLIIHQAKTKEITTVEEV